MALQHIIQHQTGAASHYWRISEIYLHSLTKTGTVKIVGYVSEQARQQNMVPLDERTFQINSTEYDTWFAPSSVDPMNINHIKNAYMFIKTQQEFLSADDV